MQIPLASQYQAFRVRAVPRLRAACVVAAIGWIIAAVGLYRQESWATWVYPWTEGRMTYIFLSSIAAAVAAPLLWCAITDEMAGIAGIALDTITIGVGISLSLILMAIARSDYRLLLFAAAMAVFAAGAIALYQVANSIPVRDSRATPVLVRIGFAVFLIALLLVGSSLILRIDGVFPWELASGTSTTIGAMFLGAAAYFAFGLVRNQWAHAGGQLAGFLAYDVVLIRPYLTTWFDRNDADPTPRFGSYAVGSSVLHETSLLVYLVVLSTSGALAVWYLFIDRSTRIWSRATLDAPAVQPASAAD